MPILPNISPELLKAYETEITKRSTPATTKRKMSSLKRFFDWAHKEGHVQQNPVSPVQKTLETKKSKRVVKPKSIKRKSLSLTLFRGFVAIGLVILIFLLVKKLQLPIPFTSTPATNEEIGEIEPSVEQAVLLSPWTIITKMNLKDSEGNPTVGSQTITFKLYKSEVDNQSFWSSSSKQLTPDADGNILISLKDVPANLFFENEKLYLAAETAQGELGSRLPVSTANVSSNLQGYYPAEPEEGALSNTIPVISEEGALLLATEAPAIKATEGNLLVEGQTITISTPTASDGDITINPDGAGIAHFLFEGTSSNFLNAQAPNLVSGSLYYGIVANNAAGYDLIRLQSGSSPITRFSVDASGNTQVGGKLNVEGDVLTKDTIRLTSEGNLKNISGYEQTSGNFSITQTGGETATISKINTTALSDLLTLTLDERGKPATSNSRYSTLTLKRYDGDNDAMALFVDEGNARFDGQVRLGQFSTNPDAIGEGSIVYNTGDDKLYYYTASGWTEITTGGGTIVWQKISGVLSPITITDDLAIGGTDSTAPFFVDDSGNVTVDGNTVLGDTSADTVTFNAVSASTLDMNTNIITNIGNAATDFDTSGGLTLADDLAVNGGDITSSGALNITPGGTVDVQESLNANNITTDTGGVSIAAGQSYTGAGAVTLSSGGSAVLTINSDSGAVTFAEDDDLIPTLGAADADVGASGTRWDNIYAVAGNFSGTVTVNDLACTDCLDFDEFANNMTLDETTDIALGSLTLSTSGTGALDFNSTGQVSFAGNVDAENGLDVTNNSLTVGGSYSWTTGGVITAATNETINGIDISAGIVSDVVSLALVTAGNTWDSSGNLTTSGNLDVDGSTNDIAGTLNLSGNTLTSAADLTINPTGGDVILSDGDVFIVGGHAADGGYNVIADSGDTKDEAAIASDNDLYIGGDLEVDGIIYGTVSGGAGSVAWDDLTTPDANLSLTHAANTTLMDWTVTGASDSWTMKLVNNAGSATTQRFVNIINDVTTQTTDVNTEALLRLDNADTSGAGSTVVDDAILVTVSGAIANGITDAIDASDANITNAINVGANKILGTTGDIDLTNFDVVGSTGNITTAGDIAVNGGDMTSSAATFNLVNVTPTILNIGGAATAVSLGAATGTTTINNATTVVTGNLDVDGSTNDIAGTLNLSGNTLTSAADLTINPTGGDVILSDGDVFIVGGHAADGGYNVIADSGDTKDEAAIASDNDLYIGGDLEVDGIIYGTVSGGAGSVAWDDLTTPDANLSLTHAANTTLMDWTVTGASDSWTMKLVNNAGSATTQRFVNIINDVTTQTTDVNTEALLRLDNADTSGAGSTVVDDAILVTVSGAIANGITDAIDASDANITNAINVGANKILGTTGDIDLTNFDVVGSTGNITTAGDIAVNGGDITSSGALNITPGGTVDVQESLNANNITTDTGGVSIAAGQSYTGAGAVTLSSGGSAVLTINSDSGAVTFAEDDDLIPTLGAADADVGASGTRWDNIYAVAGNFSGTVTVNDLACTDCLDFDEFANNMTLDETTDIALGSLTLSTSGTGALDFNSTGQVSFAGNVDAENGLDVTNNSLTVGGSYSWTTGGVITAATNETINGIDISAGIVSDVVSLALVTAGNTWDSSGNLTTSGNLDVDGSTNDIAGTLNLSGNTLTSAADLTINPTGGDVILSDGDVFIVGGHAADGGYNVIADSGDTKDEAAIASDNDLYIGGDLEVDGIIYGTVSGGAGSVAWDDLTTPDANLSLSMTTFTTDFNWATGTSTNDLFSLTTDASANGTGSLLNIQTGASATVLPLRVRAGAVEALAVDASGQVGIGTTGPGYKLDVSGTLNATGTTTLGSTLDVSGLANFAVGLDVEGTANSLFLSGSYFYIESTNNIFLRTQEADALILGTNNSEQMRIDGSGNVGIGDTTPDGLLDVEPTGAVTTASYGINLSNLTTNVTTDAINKYGAYITSTGSWTGSAGTDTNNYGLYVDTVSGADNNYGAYFADNVGIGTTGPGAKLEIEGIADEIQLIVQANATQTANILEIQDSDVNVLSGTDERGILFSHGGIDTDSVYIGSDAGNIGASGALRNIGIGTNALISVSSGDNNVGVGVDALNRNTTAGSNTGIGFRAGYYNAGGSSNVYIGVETGYGASGQSNESNTGVGAKSLRAITTGDYNVGLGGSAGRLLTIGSNNVFLGYSAGYRQTTNSNLLIVDNQARADVATELTNSILYGVMAAVPADQTLRVNADLILGDVSTLEVGGLIGVAYNAFADSGEAPEEGSISSDNDLYIGGDLEVDGIIYGTVIGDVAWDDLTDPDANLSLSMTTFTTDFNWATGTSTNDLFSLTTDASANGTGSLLNIQTGASATVLPLRVRAGAVEALAVDASGEVGIGNSAPTTALHIGTNAETHTLGVDDVLISSDLEIDGTLYVDGGTIANVAGTGAIIFTPTPTTTENSLSASSWLVENTANVGKAALMVNQTKDGDIFAASASAAPKFVINNSGNVGIGTTNPATMLHLFSDASGVNPVVLIEGATADPNNAYPTLRFFAADATPDINSRIEWGHYGDLEFATVTDNIGSSRDIKMTIDNSGNVGIGATPEDDKLTVDHYPEEDTGSAAILARSYPTITNDGDYNNYALLANIYPQIPTTKTNSGDAFGLRTLAYGRVDELVGTMANLYGLAARAGILSGTGTVTNAFGVNIYMNQSAGTIDNSYGLYISAPGTGGTVTNEWAIYVADDADNYFAGDVGIGTTSPDFELDVNGNARIGSSSFAGSLSLEGTSPFLRFVETDATDPSDYWMLKANADDFSLQWYDDSATTWNHVMYFEANGDLNIDPPSGDVGIGRDPAANNLEVEGTASKTAPGDWVANSDIRIKMDVEGLDNALDIIDLLRPVKFKYTDEYMEAHPSLEDRYYYNFIAQEFQEVFPDSVKDSGENGILQLDSYNVRPYLVAAMQELNTKVEALGFILEENELVGSGSAEQIIPALSDYEIFTENTEYKIKTISGEIVEGIEALAGLVVANIKAGAIEVTDLTVNSSAYIADTLRAGAIETANVTTDTLSAFQASVDNLLITNGLVSPVIETNMISPIADSDLIIDLDNSSSSATNPSFGELIIKGIDEQDVASIDAEGNATFSGKLESGEVKTKELTADKIYVDEIISKSSPSDESPITIEQIEELLKQSQEDQELLADVTDSNIFTTTDSASLEELVLGQLYVTGQAAINTLSVSTSLTVGSDFIVQSFADENETIINSLDTLSAPLKLQSLAMAPLEIMAGKVIIDTEGNVEITGNLYVAGQIESSGLTLKDNNSENDSGFGNLLSLVDAEGAEVASIDVSGAAQFESVATNKLIIASSDLALTEPNVNGEIETNATVGSAIIPAGMTEIKINNPNIGDYTLVYVTPTSSTLNNVLYVKSKQAGSFTVGFNNPLSIDVNFNWWVIDATE